MSGFKDDAQASRFELDEGGGVTFADYRREPGRLIIDHVETPISLRGQGAAGRLMEAILARAAEENREVVPLCSYAAAWLKRRRSA